MFIKRLRDCSEFTAGDNSRLREIFNPSKEDLKVRYSIAWAQVTCGEKTLPHKLTSAEVYYILKGTGKMHINNEEMSVGVDDTVYIPPDSLQYIENTGEGALEFLCIVDPAWEPDAEQIIQK